MFIPSDKTTTRLYMIKSNVMKSQIVIKQTFRHPMPQHWMNESLGVTQVKRGKAGAAARAEGATTKIPENLGMFQHREGGGIWQTSAEVPVRLTPPRLRGAPLWLLKEGSRSSSNLRQRRHGQSHRKRRKLDLHNKKQNSQLPLQYVNTLLYQK